MAKLLSYKKAVFLFAFLGLFCGLSYADVNYQNEYGRTALMVVTEKVMWTL